MEKPLYELKRFGHRIHVVVQREAKRHGIDFMAGPQGQVLHLLGIRENAGEKTFIKDIERSLDIAKSVASNLVKRMEANGLIYLEASSSDKRAKYVYLTDAAKEQLQVVRDFFDHIDQQLLTGISEEELKIFQQVLDKFIKNIEKIGEKHDTNV